MPAVTEFLNAVRSGDVAAVQSQLTADSALAGAADDNGTSAVMLAMYYGHPELVPVLRSFGAGLSLPEACAAGDVAAVERHLEAVPECLNGYTTDGWTPLHLAGFFGHAQVTELLLNHGADTTLVSRNPVDVTPLQSALARGEEECAALLISRGADVAGGASRGWPPIVYTGANGLLQSARLLLEHGAAVNARTPDGKSALELAEEKGHAEVAGHLREHGGV